MEKGNKVGRKANEELLSRSHPVWQSIADDPKLQHLNWKAGSIHKYVSDDKHNVLTRLRESTVVDEHDLVTEEGESSYSKSSKVAETFDDLQRIHLFKFDLNYAPSYKGTNIFKFHAYNFSSMELHVQKVASSLGGPIFIGSGGYNFHKMSTEFDEFAIDDVSEVTLCTMIDQWLYPFATLVQQTLDDAKFYNFLMESLRHVGKFTLPTEVTLYSEKLVDSVCRAFYRVSKTDYCNLWIKKMINGTELAFQIDVQSWGLEETLSLSTHHNENKEFHGNCLKILLNSRSLERFYQILRAIFILLGSENRSAQTEESEILFDHADQGILDPSAGMVEILNVLKSKPTWTPVEIVQYILDEAKDTWFNLTSEIQNLDDINCRYCINLVEDFVEICRNFHLYLMRTRSSTHGSQSCKMYMKNFYEEFDKLYLSLHDTGAAKQLISVYEFLVLFTEHKKKILNSDHLVALFRQKEADHQIELEESQKKKNDTRNEVRQKNSHQVTSKTSTKGIDGSTEKFNDQGNIKPHSVALVTRDLDTIGLTAVENLHENPISKSIPSNGQITEFERSAMLDTLIMVGNRQNQVNYNHLRSTEDWGGNPDEPDLPVVPDSDECGESETSQAEIWNVSQENITGVSDQNLSDEESVANFDDSFSSSASNENYNGFPNNETRRGNWRCLIINGNSRDPSCFPPDTTLAKLVNTCPMDSLFEVFLAAYEFKPAFKNFVDAFKLRYLSECKFFKILTEYVEKKSRSVYYQGIYELVVLQEQQFSMEIKQNPLVGQYLEVDCRDNIMCLFRKVVKDYACVASEYKCSKASCKYIESKNSVFQSLDNKDFVVTKGGSLECLQDHLDSYYS
ncbi:hypothetical protein QAD02_013652 [Eretmocerus hayati]|uniref:Uncharacterized protein n=1 Tax=Eretmocerus hayati TaxID=131215 RepID=A0ACC2P7V8_9HYME|nr:hypothetical protein QAD02_013652 [Eretmocerus hayati]